MLTWFDYFKIAWLSTHIFYSFFHWKPSTLVSSSADCFRLTQGTNIFKNWHICPWLFYFVWIFSWLFTSQESIHQRTIISFISHFNLLFNFPLKSHQHLSPTQLIVCCRHSVSAQDWSPILFLFFCKMYLDRQHSIPIPSVQ